MTRTIFALLLFVLATNQSVAPAYAEITVCWTDFTESTQSVLLFTASGNIGSEPSVFVEFSYSSTENQNEGDGGSIQDGMNDVEHLLFPNSVICDDSVPANAARPALVGGAVNPITITFSESVSNPFILVTKLGGATQADSLDFGSLNVTYLAGNLTQDGNKFISSNDAGGQNRGAFRVNGIFESITILQRREAGIADAAAAEFQIGIDQTTLLGDLNQDGFVNLLDVAPFIELLSSGDFQAEGDCNLDGVVNLLDVDPFIAILGGG